VRIVAAIMLGRVALDPSDSTLTAGMSGAIVHLFLATLFGSIFGAIQNDRSGGQRLRPDALADQLLRPRAVGRAVVVSKHHLTVGAIRSPHVLLWHRARTLYQADDHDAPRALADRPTDVEEASRSET
jgi:hypothetical protein